MEGMTVYNLILLILFVTFAKCHDYQQQQTHNYGVKGQTGHNIKSYGGYFPDTSGYNEAANNFVNTQNYFRPPIAPYHPYGWNFNQPTRTYGGVNVASHNSENNPQQNQQQTPDNRIGWANNNNYAGLNPNPLFPNLPQQPNLFVPNFYPQFPFPPFPNMFSYPNNYPQAYPNYPPGPHINNNNNQGNGFIQPPQGPLPYPQPNINQGFPTINRENSENTPNHGQVPQTNIHQSIPEGNINRRPDPNLNHVTSTERIQNKAGGPTTVKPLPTTIVNTIFSEDESTEGVDYQFPQNPDFSKPNVLNNSSGIDIRTTGLKPNVNNTRFPGSDLDKDKGFASNSFFDNNDQRQWTKDDELKWLATTKAPYFENKVPGLECTLPAAAVLGAKNAFKVSTLLPLDVPPGKPLLSCNATDLLQSQILLDGMTYDCSNSEITLSCLTHGGLIDECEGQTLQCDTDNLNVDKVWCTNGTLVSSSDVECRNAFVEAHKSTLNCFFKHTRISSTQTTQRPTIVNVLPVVPLPTPESNTEIDNRNKDEDFDYGNIDEQSEEPQDLMPQVKNAMKNVFPHDLLTMPSTGYLPPKSSMQPLNPNLKTHINSVFNTDMLASSKNPYDFSNVRDQISSNWNINSNIKTRGNDVVKTKPASTVNRFGSENNQQRPNLRDRLIFTD
ncbi:hypothetical protein ACKWTF_002105 [Chironomus riparius]